MSSLLEFVANGIVAVCAFIAGAIVVIDPSPPLWFLIGVVVAAAFGCMRSRPTATQTTP